MAQHTVTLIPGDGIGPETSSAMQRVLEAAGAEIEWEIAEAGAHLMEEHGTPLPQSTLDAVKRNKVAIKGPVTTPVGSGFRSVNVALRKAFDLYVNLRPNISIEGAGGRYNDVDLVIVRENTEDLYAGIEFEQGSSEAAELIEFCASHDAGTIREDAGISVKPISITGSRNIVKYAFEYAIAQGRKKVTAVHKANIMKHSDGLFLRVAREVAKEYEGRIEFEDKIVDAFCMNMVIDPSRFDVVVLPNLYGDIASDLCAGLVGGLGIAPGANIGKEYAIFEAVHGSAPDIAGQNKANPTAEILSACMMLDYLGEQECAERIRSAVRAVYAEGEHLTGDIRWATGSSKPACSTTEFTDALIAAL
ncbi:isocitrate/isopropylmalate dehydrogenase family protein [Denitrobacterium detoxificans]|jgi:isocitrate dehydrogenase (NAD+)|uniref:isocitrate/isopropylmalate dehydrogenase family protein n=1 Tax=Denitrobacterium detoxificans TaxID=79604 RepID=UPI0026EE9AED|nr:isocitrate/isopropylmalate family dehydrogenase [Denitrobacterium detoxificans]MBE6465738.1 isocitrate/isopropylmalate dehydrogenase family protein [Denitrobacterium detoxificans]